MNEDDNERKRESLQRNAERILRDKGYHLRKNMLYIHAKLELSKELSKPSSYKGANSNRA